jgi:FkbM family methyltransferase
VDVGASGGIEQYWRAFEPDLTAFGFEPLVKECERLNSLERTSKVKYLPYFVGDEAYDSLFPPSIAADPILGWSDDVYPRTSAVLAQKLMSMSFTQRFNNENPEIVFTSQKTSLDNFFSTTKIDTVDFVKVDTDGHDYEVLTGARKIAAEKQVLGFFVECQLHGISHPHSNLFSNIDRLMRELGFSLFDIEVYRYSRAALPGHFVYDIPAQTREGQVVWGDALFLRDITADGYESHWLTLPPLKLLKLVCLHELFGMPDCAAEILLKHQAGLKVLADPAPILDMLTQVIDPAHSRFSEYLSKFNHSPKSVYPQAPVDSPPRSRRFKSALVKRLRRILQAT